MIFSIIHSAQNDIIEANGVDIETDISNGLHSFTIVGLADKAVDESKDRISSAIKNSGFTSPKKKNQKIVISLAPANLRKSGTNFDLAMALAYLKSSGEIEFESNKKIFLGELSLDGRLRKINGILPMMIYAKKNNFSEVFIPSENLKEAGLITGLKIYPCKNLLAVINHLKQKQIIIPHHNQCFDLKNKIEKIKKQNNSLWLKIIGQEKAKRALQIVAAGGHNLGLYGPPGTGKTILARSVVSLFPPLKYDQMVETTSIHSISGNYKDLIYFPPFRNPHHTSSHSSIIGGGAYLKPGEISLAHNGILFLDEAPEFNQKIIDSLRQPIEDGYIALSRIQQKAILPTKFVLIAAMNPCPCGYYKSNIQPCVCTIGSIQKYRKKISGPIIDRIGMWTEVNNLKIKELNSITTDRGRVFGLEKKLSDLKIKELQKIQNSVITSREIQEKRQGECILNADLEPQQVEKWCYLNNTTRNLLGRATEQLKLSARSYYNILKISRTIADIEQEKKVLDRHILEALQYRPKL